MKETIEINGKLINAFIPKNFIVECFDNKKRFAKLAVITHQHQNGKYGVDFYYSANFAKFHLVSEDDLILIDGFEETKTTNGVELYKKVFEKERNLPVKTTKVVNQEDPGVITSEIGGK